MLMSPFEPFREMERLMEETLSRMRTGIPSVMAGRMIAPVDVCESRDEFLVRVALPGVRPEDVEVTSHEDTITIRGKVSMLAEGGEGGQPERHIHVQGAAQPTTQAGGQQPMQGRGQQAMTQREAGEWTCLIREIPTGRFTRTITLPAPIAAEQAEARFDHGILTLRLPKKAEARPRTIQVRGE